MPAELPRPILSIAPIPSLPIATPGRPGAGCRWGPGRWPAATWLLTLLFLLLSGVTTAALAQTASAQDPPCAADEKFANTWYFGFTAGLDFNAATTDSLPKVLLNSKMAAPAGSGVMSDSKGKILFYSNGETVWNGDGTVMINGTGLAGNRFTTDGPLPIKMPGIPMPGQPTRYLLFTLNSTAGLSYSEIDIPAAGGAGTVVTKNVPLARGTAEKLTGVFHRNGCDIWVITHGWGDAKTGNDNRGDAFLAYRVTTAGVNTTPIPSSVGSLHALSVAALGYKGQMKVTPDGQRLALARYSEVTGVVGDSSSTVELFSFNNGTGKVSVNPKIPYIVDRGKGKYYGVGFSPGSYLYATVMNPPQLLQFDISGNGPVTKQNIPLKQKMPADLGSLQAAPDGKIYVARNNRPALGFIAYPDSLGAKAHYADDSLKLRGVNLSGLGLVNFNQSSLLRVGPSAQITGCKQITFTAPPINFKGKLYTWTFDGVTKITRSAKDSIVIQTYADPGPHKVTLLIETECFCRQSSGFILVPDLPKPGSIAGSQELCAGTAPALLTSTADASGDAGLPLVYQWESSSDNVTFNPVAGTTSSYLPTNLPTGITYFRRRAQLLLPNRAGPYCESKFTTAVTITVRPILTAGSIAADQTVCAGAAAAPLTSTAPATGGTGTPAYQWQSSSDNSIWVPASGINTDATYTPGALTATTYFRRRATSGPCTALSNTVVVTVAPALAAGTIAADQALCAGAAPSPLTSTALAAGGTGAIAYQWESMLGNAPWGPVPGPGNDATYAPGALTATTYFRRRATSASGCAPVFSNVVVITVTPALAAGAIAASQGLCPDAAPAPFTSTAAASGGNGSYSYQRETSADNSNWVPAPGTATGETYTPNTPTTTTYYRRRVTSGVCGPAYSNVVTLTVLPPLSAGSISASQTICTGATPSSLSSTTEAGGGTGTFTYQWEFSTDNVYWNPVTGATSLIYAPGPLTATTYYRRRVTSGSGTCSTAVSNVLTILVQPFVTPSVSLATPPAQCPGTAFTFTAVATNAGTAPAFQWFVNNVAVASGPNFTSSTLANGDQVRVEVTPTAGLCVTTNLVAAIVTVTRTPTPTPTLAIAVQPDGPVCLGAPLTFSIASVTEAGPAPAYQWQVNGNDVAGATGPVFTSTALRNGQIVTLRLRTTNVCGQPVMVVSNGVGVRIQPPVVVNAGPDKEILLGTSVVLEGTADGNYPVTWTPAAGLTISASDPLHPVAAPTVTTTYTLSAGAGGCASSDQVTVTVRPPIRIPNAFTPNNDGRDDTWQIEFIEQFPDNTVSVFNRWGNRVFSTEHYSRANEWRGDINGQPAPVGTYYYVVVTKGPLGRSYAGSITILY